MKLHRLAALAWFAAAPVLAAPTPFSINFEKQWDFANGAIDNYYAGGTAADGTTGPNLGVSFSNVIGLSNDQLGPYYGNAASPLGVAYADGFNGIRSFMNVANGVDGSLNFSFYYSSVAAVTSAIVAWSGLNGTGSVLGTVNLAANTADYTNWNRAMLSFNGLAHSFEFTASAPSVVLFDNILVVPEPETIVLLAMGGAAALCLRGRRRDVVIDTPAMA